jgi:hypothetical protein
MVTRHVWFVSLFATLIGVGSAWAQFSVTDPATTARNAAIAALRNRVLDTVRAHEERLRKMASRLSADTSLDKYRAPAPPSWEAYAPSDAGPATAGYRAALRHGDAAGEAYDAAVRRRRHPAEPLAAADPRTRASTRRALATLDAADSANILATHQVGLLRAGGRAEHVLIDALERDVLDPSAEQSATAILDKVSAGALLEAHQKQTRLRYLAAIVEQLIIDNKRARDAEAAALNMQLHRLRSVDRDEDGRGLLSDATDDLRTWRQP